MKALGKISSIEVAYQVEKTSDRDGHKYWGERYTIYFESGDDIHMVDSGWLHCAGKDGGLPILAKRGIAVGARGEMTIRYGFRDWNGKRFPECELVRFDSMEAKPASSTEAKPAGEDEVKPEGEDEAKPADGHQSVEEMMADAAAEAEEKQGDDLPF